MPFWASAFLDLDPLAFDDTVAFWASVTGWPVSPARGEHGEFATLVPGDGDDVVRVQRLGEGPSRIHLDLHVADPQAAAGRAEALGARVVVRHDLGYVVLASPGGLTFCLVSHPAAVRPRPATWPGGGRSILDQVCLDIPPASYDAEVAFWRDLTGWALREPRPGGEFGSLVRPAGQPLRLLLQRVDDDRPTVTAHLDLAADDRDAEVRRHVALGATPVRRHDDCTVLTDPAGSAYCVTDRDPDTGLLEGDAGPTVVR